MRNNKSKVEYKVIKELMLHETLAPFSPNIDKVT